MKQITKRQREVLREIYNLTRQGLPPTFAELRKKLGISSNQTIKDFITALSVKGYVKQESYKARAITISEKGFEEINNFNKEINFVPDFNPIANQSSGKSFQDINNSSSFSENTHEYNNIPLKINY